MKVINLVVDKVIKAVMAVSGIVLLAVTFWQVVCRYVLKAPLPWSQDIIRLSFTYLVFWGAAYCVHEKANLNVDVLLTSLPKVIGKLLEIIINVVLVGFFVFLLYMGLQFAQTGTTQTTSYLPSPMSWYYMSIPSAAAFMIFYMIGNLAVQVKEFIQLKKGEK